MARQVYEGSSITIPFFRNSTGDTATLAGYFYIDGGTAEAGLDYFDKTSGPLYGAAGPAGQYAYSFTVSTKSDSLIEGTESFTVVQYDVSESGNRFDFDYVAVDIIDASFATIYYDYNGDGVVDPVEVNAYNAANISRDLQFEILENKIKKDKYDELLKELEVAEGDLKSEIAQRGVSLTHIDEFIIKRITKKFTPNLADKARDVMYAVSDLGYSAQDLQNDANARNLADVLVKTLGVAGSTGNVPAEIASILGEIALTGLASAELGIIREKQENLLKQQSEVAFDIIEYERALESITKIKSNISPEFKLVSDSDHPSPMSLNDRGEIIEYFDGAFRLGTTGDDVFIVNRESGSVYVFGEEGFDTIDIDADRASVVISKLDERTISVLDVHGYRVLLDVEKIQFQDGAVLASSLDDVFWADQTDDVKLVASTYNYLTNKIPTVGGFEYLIASDDNKNDLSDDYYKPFNLENKYINFASNLAFQGGGREVFAAKFGERSFEDVINLSFEEIIGTQKAENSGINVEDALAFFQNALGFYSKVAKERVVSSTVDLEDATKAVIVGSILNEAIKSGVGNYAEAVGDLVVNIVAEPTEVDFGAMLI